MNQFYKYFFSEFKRRRTLHLFVKKNKQDNTIEICFYFERTNKIEQKILNFNFKFKKINQTFFVILTRKNNTECISFYLSSAHHMLLKT